MPNFLPRKPAKNLTRAPKCDCKHSAKSHRGWEPIMTCDTPAVLNSYLGPCRNVGCPCSVFHTTIAAKPCQTPAAHFEMPEPEQNLCGMVEASLCPDCGEAGTCEECKIDAGIDAVADATSSHCPPKITRIYGEGKPGERPCLWPDEEAPFDWDDPAICRALAVKAIRFKGAMRAVPTCAECLRRLTANTPIEFTIEEVQ